VKEGFHGGLQFDEAARAGHHHVHVHFKPVSLPDSEVKDGDAAKIPTLVAAKKSPGAALRPRTGTNWRIAAETRYRLR
jgi:hypothetical protein